MAKKAQEQQEQQCFVITPIGDVESETRKRSDQIFKHVISPAVEECGYSPLRADHISEPGIITSQVIQHIVNDPLVIADLSGRNPNVFYELAVRHAIKKPLVQIIKKGESIPFDVAGTRTIHVDHHDLDSVEEAKKEIVKQIKSVEKDAGEVDSPISVALDLQILRQSENPEQRSLADLVAAISDLRSGIISIDEKINDPSSLFPREYLEHVIRRSRMFDVSRDYVERLDMLIRKSQILIKQNAIIDSRCRDKLDDNLAVMYSNLRHFRMDRD